MITIKTEATNGLVINQVNISNSVQIILTQFAFTVVRLPLTYFIFKGATKFYFMQYLRVVIVLFKRVYISQYFISVLLENYSFVFLCFLRFLSALCFQFDVIFVNLLIYV